MQPLSKPDRQGSARWLFAVLFCLLALAKPTHLHAQSERESSLSEGEVDKLRESAISPPERLLLFVGFLNDRVARVNKLSNGPRKPGREEDIHDLMEQCTNIFDDLADNLDDYGKRHRDVRKALPKLLGASEAWATGLKTPPENQQYSVSRKLALESLAEVHETASKMLEEQKAWFTTHPPGKEGSKPSTSG